MTSARPGDELYRLPRELVEGIVWLGDCLPQPVEADILHSYDSLFLIKGEDASLLVEAGLL